MRRTAKTRKNATIPPVDNPPTDAPRGPREPRCATNLSNRPSDADWPVLRYGAGAADDRAREAHKRLGLGNKP
jgi:hypothetical protein